MLLTIQQSTLSLSIATFLLSIEWRWAAACQLESKKSHRKRDRQKWWNLQHEETW